MSNEQILEGSSLPPLTQLTEDEQMLKEAAADFAQSVISPQVQKMDHDAKLNPELVKAFFDMGLMGIEVPGKYDGGDGTFFMSILAIEQISKVDASAGVFMDVQNTLVNNAFLRWGNDTVKQKYLPLLSNEKVGSYALSEAASGSDAFGLKCKARKEGDHYVLNGTKLWITNANEADIFLIFANLNPDAGYKGITAFIVERGFRRFHNRKKRR